MTMTCSDNLCAENYSSRRDFRVIIVGGSIAGLTLAHSLRGYNIDYVVLEAYNDIAPQIGASIGLAPSGCGILDQLGMIDDVLHEIEPLGRFQYYTDAGNKIFEDKGATVIHERHGYPLSFLDRHKVLEILYDHLGKDQSRVFLNKKVTHVEDVSGGVVVRCKDGSQWTGDMVVGADGIHSTIRTEIWNRLEKEHHLRNSITRERKEMLARYSCIFGISADMNKLVAGHGYRTFGKGFTTVIMVGKNHRTFWFLFAKMDRTYTMENLPRFTAEDRETHAAQYFHVSISPDVSFGDLYEKADRKTYVPLEEAFYEHWVAERLVCIGDSAHKMTPNMGQGGNCAIESAASLANCLKRFVDLPRPSYSTGDLHHALSAWSTARQPRARKICRAANKMTRVEAWESVLHQLIICYTIPYISNILVDMTCLTMVGSEILEYLPTGKISRECQMPADVRYRNLQQISFGKRVLCSTPLILCYLGACCLQPAKSQNACYVLESSSNPVAQLQKLSFLADLGLLYGIWLLESYRRSHSLAGVILPILIAFLSLSQGIGRAATLYFLLDYLQSPLEYILVSNYSSIRIPAAKTLLPALILGYYLPLWAGYSTLSLVGSRICTFMWPLNGLLVPGLQLLLAALTSSTTPTKEKRPDMSHVRWTIILLAAVSGVVFHYVQLNTSATSFREFTLFQYDALFTMLSSMAWILLSFLDLQVYGIRVSLLKVAVVFAGTTIVAGPGVGFAVCWAWREEVIANIIRRG
ncbi:hypothetical protein BJY01DRAFT_237006 [Aspergillus pseudoustus]|uniref:FAD-binding domain-containing protein n=1 Tax=Aspergillus pseudoustus TaxID=1810923 RepID=A0ABR4JI82_9EURO